VSRGGERVCCGLLATPQRFDEWSACLCLRSRPPM
jgi:hypothetical protein